MNNAFKSGFVSIIGRPNAGKSTLLNQLIKEKIAIVTPKAQTTRNQIQGILTTDDYQIVFIDTPGIHLAKVELSKVMNQMAYATLDGTDAIIFIVDVTKKVDDLDREIAGTLNKLKVPIIIAINKVDLIENREDLDQVIFEYRKLLPTAFGVTLSALNCDQVDVLLDKVLSILPYGPMYYPEDEYTLVAEKFLVAEIIREKILLLTQNEVPHSVAVTIDSYKDDLHNPNLKNINATIVVERASQKKIIIGAKGAMIKQIGTLARADIVKLIGKKVYLELFVKVEENWRNRAHHLNEYGYKVNL